MNKYLAALAVLLLWAFVPAHAADEKANPPSFTMEAFGEIPVLHEGRIKPLESFARTYLLAFYGKSSLPHEAAIAWMAELLLDPEKAYQRHIFNIPTPDVVNAIGLTRREGHRYSFNELSKAFDTYGKTIKAIGAMDDGSRTPPQRQLLELYARVTAYAILSESISLMQPRFKIKDPSLAEYLHLPVGQDLTFFDLMPHETEILGMVDGLRHKNPAAFTAGEKERAFLALDYVQLSQHEQSVLFRIIPPQWREDGDTWMSPWEALLGGHGSPQSAAYLELWKKMAAAYAHNDPTAWQTYARKARDKAYELAGSQASLFRQKLEVFYLEADLFTIALAVYLVSFVLLMAVFLGGPKVLYKATAVLMPVGAFLHAGGIALRIVIMNRPPVATLYETTIFVSFMAVFLSLLFERQRRDGIGLMTGSVIGTALLFISTRYAADGDTMEMLVAVLNTNFWLATHVVAVTMGYGCALVAGTLGHVYLVSRWRQPGDVAMHKRIQETMLTVALIAAFFATLGTILGGIWADQSWGRFWGWDPKENGAMFVVLWLLWSLHGRIAGVLAPINFASGMVLTNIVVALSWFGVNLLSVGLHSYGFTANIAANLGLFCGAEILFLVVMRFMLAAKTKKAKA